MNTDILYEHPLNAKVRIYLRLEHLFSQLETPENLSENAHWHTFFKTLFDLLEILEQVHVRGDLIKDLEKQREKISTWLKVPGIDSAQIYDLIERSTELQTTLLNAPRPGIFIREDKFLTSIRHRFSLPGGTCSFDVPLLHHWLNLPLEQKRSDTDKWRCSLSALEYAVMFWLELTRGLGNTQPCSVKNGFYQQDAEGANMLRIMIPAEYNAFPMVSGHKSRFAIRFMPFNETVALCDDMMLSLAVC